MRRAILDIGYNAIRTVVYNNETIGATELVNIKFKNDILSLLESESLDIRHQTYLNIEYFLHIFKNLDVEKIDCVATEVLRNHPRSEEFTQYIEKTFGLNIDVISGQKEAEISAIGLMVGIPGADGIAADLGGGSLELVEVKNNQIGNRQSFPLGTKLVTTKNITKQEEIIEEIRTKIWNNHYDNLYFIGGSLRFLARKYIDNNSPVKNLHHLEIPADEMIIFLNDLEKKLSVENLPYKNRGQINKAAILVARSLISVFRPEKIIVSTYGLKEGVRSQTNYFLGKNIIFEKTKTSCDYNVETKFVDYIDAAQALLSEEKDYSLLIQCSIMLLSLKSKFDKTMPPNALSEYIMQSESPYSYKFRLMLTLIICYSTNFKPSGILQFASKQVLTKKEHITSQIIGNYLRICEEVDGPIFKIPSFKIVIKDRFLEIKSEYILPKPIFEKVCNRLKLIAQARIPK